MYVCVYGRGMFADKSVYINIVCFDVGCFWVWNLHALGSFEKGPSKTPLLLLKHFESAERAL